MHNDTTNTTKTPAKASPRMTHWYSGHKIQLQRLCEVYHNLPHKAWDGEPSMLEPLFGLTLNDKVRGCGFDSRHGSTL